MKRSRNKRQPVGRPRGSSSEATQARILAAARTCFARSGYAATTNKEIADEAGVTTAAIYLYWDSKTALYLATVRDAYADMVPVFREAVVGTTSARDGLRAILAASAVMHERDPSLAQFFSALPVEMRRHEELMEAAAQAGREIVEIFSGVVSGGVSSGEIPSASAANVLSLIIACTMGFSMFASAIDSSQLGGILSAFIALIEGTLFRAPKKKRATAR